MLKRKEKINYFIAGFIAGEGCFYWKTSNTFTVEVHIRDKNIIFLIQRTLKCGVVKVYKYRPKMIRYYVTGNYYLKKYIIPFFDKYLITSYKKIQYNEWRKKVFAKKDRFKNNGAIYRTHNNNRKKYL